MLWFYLVRNTLQDIKDLHRALRGGRPPGIHLPADSRIRTELDRLR
jgi:hypothetical protein